MGVEIICELQQSSWQKLFDIECVFFTLIDRARESRGLK